EQKRSGEVGHPAYQHPLRAKDNLYSSEVDRFSNLVVVTALHGLADVGPSLWEKYDNGDNLLFQQGDFVQPARSHLFAELLRSKDATVTLLVRQLIDACRAPLDKTPLVQDILADEAPKVVVPIGPRPGPAGSAENAWYTPTVQKMQTTEVKAS